MIIALVFPVLVGMISLGTDMMVMYYNWQKLQSAADSAALAGATSLPGDPATAVSDAQKYAANNGVQSTEIAATSIAADDSSITVSLQRDVPGFFARALAYDSFWVKVSAKAGVQSNPNGTSGLVPIGLSCNSGIGGCNYQTGWYQLKSSQVGPGNWAPIELGGTPGGSAYETYLQYGYNGQLSSTVPTETGNLVGPTGQAISYRLARGQAEDPSSSYSSPQDYDPRLVAIPLIEFNDANGKKPVTIIGYAKAWVGSLSDNNNTINVYFEGFISDASYTLAEQNFGLDRPVLIQ